MKPDLEKVKALLAESITIICKNGLQYRSRFSIQGLLGVTLDDDEVFLVSIHEKIGEIHPSSINTRGGPLGNMSPTGVFPKKRGVLRQKRPLLQSRRHGLRSNFGRGQQMMPVRTGRQAMHDGETLREVSDNALVSTTRVEARLQDEMLPVVEDDRDISAQSIQLSHNAKSDNDTSYETSPMSCGKATVGTVRSECGLDMNVDESETDLMKQTQSEVVCKSSDSSTFLEHAEDGQNIHIKTEKSDNHDDSCMVKKERTLSPSCRVSGRDVPEVETGSTMPVGGHFQTPSTDIQETDPDDLQQRGTFPNSNPNVLTDPVFPSGDFASVSGFPYMTPLSRQQLAAAGYHGYGLTGPRLSDLEMSGEKEHGDNQNSVDMDDDYDEDDSASEDASKESTDKVIEVSSRGRRKGQPGKLAVPRKGSSFQNLDTTLHNSGASSRVAVNAGSMQERQSVLAMYPSPEQLGIFFGAVTPEKPYICRECGEAFVDQYGLEEHALLHTKQRWLQQQDPPRRRSPPPQIAPKPYNCDQCGKGFKQVKNLKRHMLLHTVGKPYSCDLCGKTFTQAYCLKVHSLIHTGEKPHKCNICGKSFRQSCSLRIHSLIHTGEKPHVCTICSKAFRHLQHLKKHLTLHEMGEIQDF